MTIESDDIPYKYIYHINVTTNSIENCEYCDTTICKGSYCFKADERFGKPFIEIPINTNTSRLNDNNTDCKMCKRLEKQVNRYILHPYIAYHNFEDSISTECTKDAQCFTNKCVNNTCIFNENNIITRCRYGRCGRFIGDPCVNKYDCSEGDCDRKCYIPDPPKIRELDPLIKFYIYFGIVIFVMILVFIYCFWCACIKNSNNIKSDNTKSYKKFNNI
ncbi:hypothetical protein PIROE2DRAFT_9640 [Piromyces sp. E2]|nr:hypothetical protein PIROE2DRAFT_9640 [Piromyces sp. E2]|eukprot:OUM63776.1 hypothetical protein PIROE2DRAFT_9640 [Piromyces sp. E2]